MEEGRNGPRVGKPDVAGNNLLHPTTCCTPLKILHASPSNFTVNCLFGKKIFAWRISLARGRVPVADRERERKRERERERALLVRLRPKERPKRKEKRKKKKKRKKNEPDRRTRQQIERFYYDAGSRDATRPPIIRSPPPTPPRRY